MWKIGLIEAEAPLQKGEISNILLFVFCAEIDGISHNS